MRKLRERFLAGKMEGITFRYVGFRVSQDHSGIVVDHSEYMEKLEGGEIDPNRATKIKRVVRSTLSAEMLSLQEGVEEAIYLRAIITEMLNKKENSLPIVPYVDNRSVTQSLYSTKLVDDKRLRIDIAAIKESIEKEEIGTVRWVQGKDQLADCLTKRGASGYELMKVLINGRLHI